MIVVIHLAGATPKCAEDIMLAFLWLDEDDRSTIHCPKTAVYADWRISGYYLNPWTDGLNWLLFSDF